MTVDIEEFCKKIDPEYGSQEHQRAFVARMRKLQEIAPCSIDHSDQTHNTSCYPTAALEAVYQEKK